MSALRLYRRLVRDERGIALVLALAIMLAFGVATTSVIAYTMSNSTEASTSSASQVAYNLADAGLSRAIAILQDPANSGRLMDSTLLATTPTTGKLSSWANPAGTTWAYSEGTARAWGTLQTITFGTLSKGVWRVTATGTAPYAAGGRTQSITRKVSEDVPVDWQTQQTLTTNAWHYVYSWKTGTPCDESIYNNTTVKSSFYVNGNLCLQTPSGIEGTGTSVPVDLIVRGYVNLNSNADIGKTKPLSSVTIQGGCYNAFSSYSTGVSPNICGKPKGYEIYPTASPTLTTPVPRPVADFVGWYAWSKPGPLNPCDPTKSSAPATWPTFDNNTVRDNSLPTVVDLTPATGYTCKIDDKNLISWNPGTKKLTVIGTIYIDGSVTSSSSPVDYDGSGAVYASGTFLLKNVTFCAIPKTNNSCDETTWGSQTSPADLLVFATDGVSTGGSSPADQVPVGDGIEIKGSSFQGALYGTHIIESDTTSSTQAPMVSETEIISQHGGTPFPVLLSVPFGIPGNLPTQFTAGTPVFYRDG
jgi:hypothetical protein